MRTALLDIRRIYAEPAAMDLQRGREVIELVKLAHERVESLGHHRRRAPKAPVIGDEPLEV